jgi:hypothetical protein
MHDDDLPDLTLNSPIDQDRAALLFVDQLERIVRELRGVRTAVYIAAVLVALDVIQHAAS